MSWRDYGVHLRDILSAGLTIQDLTIRKSLKDYEDSPLLRAAVERLFILIGEAMAQLRQARPELLAAVDDHRQFLTFRDMLVHGHAAADEAVVWSLIHEKLPRLLAQADQLLSTTRPDPLTSRQPH